MLVRRLRERFLVMPMTVVLPGSKGASCVTVEGVAVPTGRELPASHFRVLPGGGISFSDFAAAGFYLSPRCPEVAGQYPAVWRTFRSPACHEPLSPELFT